jgi:hypothetical protein
MATWTRQLTMCAVAVCGLGRAAAASTPPASVTVRVVNAAQLPATAVQHAQEMAGGIFKRAGVLVRWVFEAAPFSDDPTLTVTVLPDAAGFPVAADTMGSARSGEDGPRGRNAFVFYDRTVAFATAGHVDLWIVLGCAIAHELGHLLLPIHAHSPDGIMRGDWDPRFVPRAGAGVLNFSTEQARLMQTRLATREP